MLNLAIRIEAGECLLDADLRVPLGASGLVIFAHGSGSSRFSNRNRTVAKVLEDGGIATLMLDLLTSQEQAVDQLTSDHRLDFDLLGSRVTAAADWAADCPDVNRLPFGLFGASTGAAAAMVAAAERPDLVRAVVSRGGRPDLAGNTLSDVRADTLLIVGGRDTAVIDFNRRAMEMMTAAVDLVIVPGASHLFEEPGALNEVASLARDFFLEHLAPCP